MRYEIRYDWPDGCSGPIEQLPNITRRTYYTIADAETAVLASVRTETGDQWDRMPSDLRDGSREQTIERAVRDAKWNGGYDGPETAVASYHETPYDGCGEYTIVEAGD